MATGVFSLRKAYKNQVENENNNNFASWPEGSTYAYFGGGYAVSSVRRIDFITETTSNPGNTLPSANHYHFFSTASDQYGWAGNSYITPGTSSSNAFRLEFVNEVITSSSPFSVSRSSAAAVDNGTTAYIGGGWEPAGVWPTSVRKLSFATGTEGTPSAITLPAGRQSPGAISGNQYGYWAGGTTAPAQSVLRSEIFRIDFSTDVTSTNPQNLPQNRTYTGGLGNKQASVGYYFGGSLAGGPNDSTPISTISRMDLSNSTITDYTNFPQVVSSVTACSNGQFALLKGNITSTIKFDLSNDVSSFPGKNISPDSSKHFGLSAKQRILRPQKTIGYIAGGRISGVGLGSNVNRLTFSTETSTNTMRMSSNRGYGTGTSSNLYGYFGGGYSTDQPTPNYSSIDRLDFSNEVFKIMGGNLPFAARRSTSTSSEQYAYFIGGETNVTSRIDFTSETISNPGKNMQRYSSSSHSNSNYGYFVSGNQPPINSILRLDFTTEAVTTLSNELSDAVFGAASFSNNSYGYTGGGIYQPTSAIRSAVHRMEYSTETFSLPGKNLPNGRYNLSGFAGDNNGYFAGGFLPLALSPTDIKSILERFDFSTENVTQIPPLLTVPSNLQTLANSN